MKDANKSAQARIVLGAVLFVASPFIAFWAAQLFTPIFCGDQPVRDPVTRGWNLFPCVDVGFYTAVTMFVLFAVGGGVLASWRRGKQKK